MSFKIHPVWYVFFVFWLCVFVSIAHRDEYLKQATARLPSLDYYQNYTPYQTAFFYDKDRIIIGCTAEEWREVIPKEDIDSLLVTKLITETEDRRYFAWYRTWLPIDPIGILRALGENILARKIVEGGSTIEQQTAKQLLDPAEQKGRTVARKIKELVIAFQLQRVFDKKTIRWLYLNEIYFGSGFYGIGAASHGYFNKDVRDLTLPEAALLAGLIKAPETFSPYLYPTRAEERRNTILLLAHQHSMINQEKYEYAIKSPLGVSRKFQEQCNREPYVTDYLKFSVLPRQYGIVFDEKKLSIAWRGLHVHTTIDSRMQKAAHDGLLYALNEYQKRQKERAVDVNGAFVVLENKTGAIRVLIGGKNYDESRYNNVTQARRQTGSAFKPFDYLPLVEEKVRANMSIPDILNLQVSNARFCCRGKTRWQRWCPHNYDESKMGAGSYRMEDAIAKSINRPALYAAMNPEKRCSLNPAVVIGARRLGIESKGLYEQGSRGQIYFRLPVALGSADVTPLELTRAYMVFANGGMFKKEYILTRIETPIGTIIPREFIPQKRILPSVAYTMESALRAVVQKGTGRSLASLPVTVAGKTGTTDHFSDAWFVGFVPGNEGMTFGVWIGGKDKTVSLGRLETGGRTAIPAVRYFIEDLLK